MTAFFYPPNTIAATWLSSSSVAVFPLKVESDPKIIVRVAPLALDVVNSSLDALYLGDNNKFISYLTKTPVAYIIYLTLYKQYYSEEWHSQEEIINLVPRLYGSRSTIINLINEGIDAGYIIKRITSSDKRSVYYELEFNMYKAIDEWIIQRKVSFKNLIKLNN